MTSRDEKLKKLEDKQSHLRAQIQKLKAREATEERKRDTRKKVVIGAIILEMVKSGEWPEDKLNGLLDRKLTRLRDRELFDLPVEILELAQVD